MPEAVDLGYAVNLPPRDAIRYFQSKGYALTWSWRDMSEEAHALAFTVAKSAKFDVLGDLREAFARTLREGGTERDFASEALVNTLKGKGWWGRVDADGGPVQLGSYRRLNTIFRTNMRSAMAAATYRHQWANRAHRPLWLYTAVMDSLTRPSHRELDGVLLPADHPAWQTIYPPNGYNCRCAVIALTEAQAARMGLTVDDGDLVRVDQDFGGRQTHTHAFVLPDGRSITPDPGFGRRPYPDIETARKLGDSMHRAFLPAMAEAATAGRPGAARIRAIGPSDDEIKRQTRAIRHDDPVRQRALRLALAVRLLDQRQEARRRALLDLVEKRGAGEPLRALVADAPDAEPAARRLRELAKLLPADWIRRVNAGPVRIRVDPELDYDVAGEYNARTKTITIARSPADGDLLHEFLHHVQETHPEIDALFHAWYRDGGRVRSWDYGNNLYDGARLPARSGAVAGQISQGEAMPLEVMPVALEILASGPGRYQLDDLVELDGRLLDLVVAILSGR